MDKRLKAHLSLLGANLIFGANFTIPKKVMPSLIHPMGFIVLRVLGATTLFWLFAFFPRERKKLEKTDLKPLVACSIFGIAINQIMFFKGLAITLPIHASLASLTTPIMIIFLSSLLIGERLTTLKFLGILLGVIGAVILVTWGK
ncbi:MAG: DMT family transporter [Chitinophagaceae bacterium]